MTEAPAGKPVLAVDLGGTKIVTALITPQGRILSREYSPTLAEEGVDDVIRRILTTATTLVKNADLPYSSLSGIAIAAAGAIDTEKGVVTDSPNLPGWHNIPLKARIEQATGARTFVLNDATAAALGEHRFGAGRGVNNLIYLTVSTGIGGGIIIGGKLYSGATGSAGELGHMTIDLNGPHCPCGNIGCLEMLASGKAIAREAQRLIAQGARTMMLEMAEGDARYVSAQTVANAAHKGDAVALSVVNKAATYLGVGLVNFVNIFNPEMIIVGGGVGKMGETLLRPARKVVAERAFQFPASVVRIVSSELGDNSGLFGAVAFVADADRSL
ncbi:MAG: ROK family protein [Dehalococcoidia bacterium]|nr:ROK family protein [Dehalococcoidia bacterium]